MPKSVSTCVSVHRVALAAMLAAATWSAVPQHAAASEGYEVALVAAPVMLVGTGLYTMFVITSATGIIYRDTGWAGTQLAFSLATIVGAGIGIGLTLDSIPGGEGLAGALGLVGGLSVMLMSYAIDALINPDADIPELQYGFAPLQRDGEMTGGMLTVSWQE